MQFSISGLATTFALTEVENKIPDVSSSVKKTNYDLKILDIESKYFTTADYNKFTSQTLDAKIKQKKVIDKSNIADFINNADLHKKKSNISDKTELKAEQDKIMKLQAFDSNYFRGKTPFENDGKENYLVSQPLYRYFKKDWQY